MRRSLFLAAVGLTLASCSADGPLDTIADTTLDPGVWRADGQKVSGALPRVVASFKPSEGADAFFTSYRTGPVFGGSCTYADGARQLVVRVESGNIRERAATLAKGHANPGESFVTKEATVRGQRATVHWNGLGKTADVVFVLQRRLLVQLVLVPAKGDEELVQLAESIDYGPLEALTFEGATAR